jgi:hypothetical protein
MYLEKDRTPNQCPGLSLVAGEDSAPMSADVLPTAMDEALEASSEEEPLKEDSPADPPGEGKPAAEESALSTCICHPESHRAVVFTSGLRPVGPVSGPLFEKGLPGSENLLNLMVL